ncbi:alpha/beta hydrolase [Roseospira visakhapatnamensis]|uniref:Pimeloyl-ACP methyl ester carboxylesterase n=1 Tax=Roseospira visakhapatnamensis TaxID=390880 RepID=A0A7W6RCY5_9PROT|nr:alpha/beta hydrolase [Roseospira visakhapatnamensis]MBB4266274.1 pimeloyl-ACP methyl ester carboxylesterase [Roseospira visakhapatnamensis]
MTLEIHVSPPAPGTEAGHPPLVFVHGAFAGAWCWQEFFTPFFSRQGYPTVAFSLRGHGGSDGRVGLDLASLSDFVADLRSVLDTLDRPAVLIGHSMGGMVVQKYLEEGEAAGLVLMASVGPWGLIESSWHMMVANPGLAAGIAMAQSLGKTFLNPAVLYHGLFATPVPAHRAEAYFQRFQPESQRVILDMSWLDVPRRPPASPVPALVMGAELDTFIPASMVRRTARWLDAEEIIVPGMAHAMMLEETWRDAAEPILDWLRETGL